MTHKKRRRKCGVLIQVHRPEKPLFGLGAVYCVPAVAAFLAAHARTPAELLAFHARGEWGVLSDADAAANDRAVEDGSRILSCFAVEERQVFVITDAADADGVRSATCLLFAEDY